MSRPISLKAARVDAGLTQKQVADMMGVTSQTVCNWERGDAGISAADFRKICEIFNRQMDDIFLPEETK